MNFPVKTVKLTDQICQKLIHKILLNCPYQISIDQLDEEFREHTGFNIPYEYYGYTYLKAYVKSLDMLVITKYDRVKLAEHVIPLKIDDGSEGDRVQPLTEFNLIYFTNYQYYLNRKEPTDSKMFAWLKEVNHCLEQSTRASKLKNAIKIVKRFMRFGRDD